MLEKRGIPVKYGVEMTEIKKSTQEVTFKDMKTGVSKTAPYNAIYALPPCKPHSNLVESGLAHKDSNNLLDIDPETLQHKKYKNIFGLGDVANLPTSKTFWAGFH